MNDCIFCKIVKRELPSYKVYEDEDFIGFLDIHPVSKGHALLIPKKHYRWVHDVPQFGEYWETARKLANAVEMGLKPGWVQYFTHGLVPHAHIHVIPRYEPIEGAKFLPSDETKQLSKDEMQKIAAQINKAILRT